MVKAAWRLAVGNWKAFAAIIVIPLALSLVAQLAILTRNPGLILVGLLLGLASLVGTLLMGIALIDTVRKCNDGSAGTVTLRSQFSYGLANFWQYVWVTILVTMFMAGLTALLMIPVVIVGGLLIILGANVAGYVLIGVLMPVIMIGTAMYVTMAAYAMLIDGKKGLTSLIESMRLIRYRWWRVLWRIVVVGVIVWIASAAIVLAVAWLLSLAGFSNQSLVTLLVTGIINISIGTTLYPFATAYMYDLYRSLRSTASLSPKPLISDGWVKASCWIGMAVCIILFLLVFISGMVVAMRAAALRGQVGPALSSQAPDQSVSQPHVQPIFPTKETPFATTDPLLLEPAPHVSSAFGFSIQWPKGWNSVEDKNEVVAVSNTMAGKENAKMIIEREPIPASADSKDTGALMSQVASGILSGVPAADASGFTFGTYKNGQMTYYVLGGIIHTSQGPTELQSYLIRKDPYVYIVAAASDFSLWEQIQPLVVDSMSTFKTLQ